ncbi:hypothetical protein KUH03_05560 [Sphingobacterium sp. E70]|uniref:hypothetical protein n=1 Tax=Sphingobacterium sp. E70 TaxID=2853439 RepID=UPI00211CCA94|nr:hypothetical protein [Sphingobacterium sp. E70]ULT26375.1 hypothetical protein KUH03_05560 [Sphingobacterium sp. E70]
MVSSKYFGKANTFGQLIYANTQTAEWFRNNKEVFIGYTAVPVTAETGDQI